MTGAASGVDAPARPVARGVWMIRLAVADPSIRAQNAYLVRDDSGGAHLIDPGEDSAGNLALLTAGIEATGCRLDDVRTVTLTHLHADHGELAAEVRELTGARLIVHEREQAAIDLLSTQTIDDRRRMLGVEGWGVPTGRVDEATVLLPPMRRFAADDVITGDEPQAIPDVPLVFIPSPGHTSGHLCLLHETSGALLTGDHVLAHVTPAVGIGGPSETNPLADYLTSLRRVRRYDGARLLPGHGDPFDGLADRTHAIADRHLNRADEVAAVLAERPGATVWQVASALQWRRPWSAFAGTYLASALLQTSILMDFVGQIRDLSDSSRRPGAVV